MAPRDLHYMDLLDVAKRVQNKELSPVEVTEAQLKRIGSKDGKLHSYATVTGDLAIKQAKKAEAEIAKGRIRGPLHGVPIAVKDLCYTKGIVTAAGTKIYGRFKPKFDATVVERFREAGAILLGKLQMTEGAYAEHHPEVAVPQNPWDANRWSGASSSGSGVATAAGLCYASLGSDTGGSIRFPSAANGVTGLKPTWGRVSRYGVFDLAPTLDHVGPMCRSAADTGAVLGVIAGADANDPTAVPLPVPNYLAGLERGIKGLRIGIDSRYNSRGVDEATQKTLAAALEVVKGLGAEIRKVTFPEPRKVVEEWVPHCGVETAYAHKDTYPSKQKDYGPALAGLIDVGREVTGLQYQEILLHRHEFAGKVRALFEDIDLLMIPAQVMASPTLDDMATLGEDPEAVIKLLRFTAPFDLTGSPAITLPAGFTGKGTPIAFQFVGRHFEEDLLVRAGHAFQRETDWHRQHPKV